MATTRAGWTVTYWPLPGEQPSPADLSQTGQLQAAMITAWDDFAQTATLTIFSPGIEYVWSKQGVPEGTTPGTFQNPYGFQPDLSPPSRDDVVHTGRAKG